MLLPIWFCLVWLLCELVCGNGAPLQLRLSLGPAASLSGQLPLTNSSKTQNSSRTEKDAQRHLEPGTPNNSPISFF